MHGSELDAVIFDTDGVITRTASVHFAAWKAVFDRVLAELADPARSGPFTDADYRHHVDGVGRYDGVEHLLRSRGVELPFGDPTDPPGHSTVCAVGNLKNDAFAAAVARRGVRAYDTTRRFVEALRAAGIRTAAVSASRNCEMVLAAAGVDGLFEARVDGNDVDRLGLRGKPAADLFLEAARRLGVPAGRAAVVEDAIAGVQAGRDGGFALVIGLDRTRNPAPLAEHADLVVTDCADLEVTGRQVHRTRPARARLADLPDAREDDDLARLIDRPHLAVFLDYDGTLTPIVERPELAVLPPAARDALEALAPLAVVGVISGRDLDDVAGMVACEGIWLSGSHGFDVRSPDGVRTEFAQGRDALPALDAAGAELAGPVAAVPGAWVERKRFAIAVHFRATPPERAAELEGIIASVADAHPDLRVSGGKMILELRPAVDWDKGRAVRWLLDATGLDPAATLVLFIGDDVTDEDGFTAVRDTGVGIVVGDEDRVTAAHDRLDDPDAVRELLDDLARRLAPR